MKLKLPLLVALCAAYSAGAIADQVYKWVDAAGVVHYSDSAPPHGTKDVQRVLVKGNAHVQPPPEAAPQSPQPSPPTQGGGKTINQSAADSTAQAAAAMARNCATARQNLELLDTAYPVSVTGNDGRTHTISAEERKAKIADAQAQVKLFCKG